MRSESGKGHEVNVITPLGYKTTAVYDVSGLETSSTDALGNVTSLVYDSTHRGQVVQTLEAYSTAVQASTLNSYDNAGLLSGSRDADGWWSNDTYDPVGRLLMTTNAQGGVTMSEYDLAGQEIASRDALGAWTKLTYNLRGWVTQVTDALGDVTSSTTYDPDGDATVQWDALRHVTTTTYDKLDRVSTVTNPLGAVETTTYDADGNVATQTDFNGNLTSYGYDKDDRQTTMVLAYGTSVAQTTTTGYDPVGNATTEVTALGTTTTVYDKDNRVQSVTDPQNHTTTTVYDADDNVVQQIDALNNTTTLVYNALNQQVATIDPLSHTTTLVYDGASQQVGSIDNLGEVSQTIYDSLGRTEGSVDGAGDLTQTQYDAAGNTAAVIDPDGNQTSYLDDALGRTVVTLNALGHNRVAYNALGQVSSVTDQDHQTIIYSFDQDNRETGESWRSSADSVVNVVTLSYDNNGNLKTAASYAGTVTMSYDALNRLSTKTDLFGVTLTYTYNTLDEVTQVQNSLGGALTSVYDSAGRLTSRTLSAGGQVARVDSGYDSRDDLTSLTRYTGSGGSTLVGTAIYSYDASDRLTTIVNDNASGATLSYETYGYDNANRVSTTSWWSEIGSTVYTGSHTYTYDASSQLLSDGTTTYSYDSNGNRTMTGYVTGTDNELTTDGTWTYTYDAAGNMIEKSKGSGLETWFYGYDNKNHLTSVEQTSNGTTVLLQVTYVYDALGDRIEQDEWQSSTGTVVTRFAYDGQNVVADLNSSNQAVSRYLYGDGTDQIWARIIPTGQTNAGVYFYLTDNLGSVRDIENASQSVVDHIDYDAYGNPTESNPTYGSRYMFDGMAYEPALGTLAAVNRVVLTPVGRWLSQDPTGLGPDSNPYRDVGNNPTNYTDLEGLEPDSWGAPRPPIIDPDKRLRMEQEQTVVFVSNRCPDIPLYLERWHERFDGIPGTYVFGPIGSLQEMLDILKRFGDHHIRRIILSGHAMAVGVGIDVLTVDANGKNIPGAVEISYATLVGPAAALVRRKLKQPGGIIDVWSCNCGTNPDKMQTLANNLNATVIAHTGESGAGYESEFKGERIRITPNKP